MPVFINAFKIRWHALRGRQAKRRRGRDTSLNSLMKEMDDENKRLKKMYAEASMQNDELKEALGKK